MNPQSNFRARVCGVQLGGAATLGRGTGEGAPGVGGSAKAAKAATPKRKSGKAITARIRDARCQPGNRQARLPAMATGNTPFVNAAGLLEVDEAERRRKLAEAVAFLHPSTLGFGGGYV